MEKYVYYTVKELQREGVKERNINLKRRPSYNSPATVWIILKKVINENNVQYKSFSVSDYLHS